MVEGGGGWADLEDELLEELGVLGLIAGRLAELGPSLVENLLKKLLARLEECQAGLVVLVRDGAVGWSATAALASWRVGGEGRRSAGRMVGGIDIDEWIVDGVGERSERQSVSSSRPQDVPSRFQSSPQPTHIFFSISSCFFFLSRLASMLVLSCRTIFPCSRQPALRQSTAPNTAGAQGLAFSMANSSSALTLISRAFSKASCLMNAVCFVGAEGSQRGRGHVRRAERAD